MGLLNLSLSPSSTIQCTNHTQSRIPSLFINHTLNHILILIQSLNTISLSTSLILSQSLSPCIPSRTLTRHRYIIHLSQSLSLCTTSHTLSHHQHTIRLIQSQDPSHTIHRIHNQNHTTHLNQNHTTLHTNHTLNLRHTTHLRTITR